MKMYLRLAFLDRERVEKMKSSESIGYIRKNGIIGRVAIDRMLEGHVAVLDLEAFNTLEDCKERKAGKDVTQEQFDVLKKALHDAGGKVHVQYLTKQNRQQGENRTWTEEQIEQVKTAVDDATQQCPTMPYAKAAEILRAKHTGMLGKISKDQVRNIYKSKVEKSGEPAKAPVGRPTIISSGCLAELQAFVAESGNKQYGFILTSSRKSLTGVKSQRYFQEVATLQTMCVICYENSRHDQMSIALNE